MSSAASTRPGVPPEWDALELAVRRLLAEHHAASRRAAAAEQRARDLEAALARLSGGGPDPLALGIRVQDLEQQNRTLQARLDDAAQRVRNLLARVNFLEEER